MMKNEGTKIREKRPILAMVCIGIFLFVAGFIITISCLEGSDRNSDVELVASNESTSSPDAFLLAGLSLSLAGVVSATAGPAAFFIHRKRSA